MLSSLDSEDLGTPGREGVITLPTTGPLLTFSTDDPGGVKAQVSWPHSHQQRGQGWTRASFPPTQSSLAAPSLCPLFMGAGRGRHSTC